MRAAFGWAQAAVEMLARVPFAALVVDLDGPDAVAFAAGAASRFDPVFLFDNWPHPRAVVPAHLTLAAAAYYQPLFAHAAETGARDAPPMFVLDRNRLAPYRDNATQFDNRWVARMPGVQALRTLRIERLLYVAPAGSSELDDLNDDFVADRAAGIAFSILPVDAIDASRLDAAYIPVARRTQFSSGLTGAVAGRGRPTPLGFGSVPVLFHGPGGPPMGVIWTRSGTWNRGWGG